MINKLKSILSSSTSKDTLVTLAGNGTVALGGMLFTVITARALAPERFGVFSALFALATLFSSLSDLGISSALINFIPKFKTDRHTILSLTFWIQIIVAFTLVAVTLSFIPFKKTLFPGSISQHFIVLSLWVFTSSLETFTQSLLKAEKRFTWPALLMTISSWSKLGFTYLLFFTDSITISRILLAGFASSSLTSILGLAQELKNIRPIFPRHYATKIFHFAKWIALMRIFSVAISRVDVILLNALGSSFAAGIFAAAGRVALLFALLVSSLGAVVAPRFSSFNHNHQIRSYIKKTSLLITAISLLMVCSIIFARPLINLVFGPGYELAVPVFRALTLAMIPFLLTIITINPLIYSLNQPRYVAKLTIIQVSLLIALDIILIPRFGAFAPTISLAISNTTVLLFSSLKLRKLLT